jgi:hypothetical protein
MKRLIVGLLVTGSVLAVQAGTAQGQLFQRKRQTQQQQQQAKLKYPPRYERVSNAWNYVYRDKTGQTKVREVYSGYSSQFPTPALFYYGYPHSGDDTGLGF